MIIRLGGIRVEAMDGYLEFHFKSKDHSQLLDIIYFRYKNEHVFWLQFIRQLFQTGN